MGIGRRAARAASIVFLAMVAILLLFALVNPPRGIYMHREAARLGAIRREWVPLEDISVHLRRAVVAAEDANFCIHWGFDMAAIRAAIEAGGGRGASTISQQTVKNVFLWQGRSWPRKALEALITPLAEVMWSKQRILEIYLNVAEFDEGVFGAGAAAQHYFGVLAAELTPEQAARLAAVLPDPKARSVLRPSAQMRARARAIRAGVETIVVDGRSACFES